MRPNFKESRKRRTKKNNRKSTKRRTKKNNRKSKQFGGAVVAALQPGTPRELDHIHSHNIYICEGHFDAAFSGTVGACPFWHNIFGQLIARSVNNKAYVNQGKKKERESSECSCCAIGGDLMKKECAVFSELQYCDGDCPVDELPEGCFKMEGVCEVCTLCKSI